MSHLEDFKRKRLKKRILLVKIYSSLLFGMLLLTVLLMLLLSGTESKPEKIGKEKQLYSDKEQHKVQQDSENWQDSIINRDSPLNIDLKSLNSPEAILLERDNGYIIAENNADNKLYPASMTKIMTAILTIENIPDLNEKIEIPSDIFQELYIDDASVAGFEPGEVAAAKDLLYGVLLPSGAECCLTLARKLSGSETEFADLMNKKAEELGMKNTQFRNSTGLQDEQHYSTVRDMAVLLNYALQNDVFRSIFTCSRYRVAPTNKHPEGFTFVSTMFKSMDHMDVDGGEVLGGKTGYTSEAGLCLASLASINGKDYILVTAGAKGDHSTEQFNITDAFSVYNQIGQELTKADQR